MVYAKEIYKGRFIPKNRQKYLGDFNKIIYRSSYELKFMNWCDRNESIIGWASEELAIPYRSPMDNRVHRYFPDFYIEVKQSDGIQKFLIEVKPDRFTRPPKAGKRKTRRYLQEIANYAVNEAKWLAAKDFSSKQNMVFKLVTEKELGI
jgi:hypothetical protein|tara:strand:+ start:2915 stop:3361 length:447 start_codon:yes stop_codon:yes gene_type:complete